jgi:nucleoside phosphorylase
LVAITGIGKSNAIRVVGRFLENVSPGLVLSCGFAGGLNPGLERGSLVFSADDGLELATTLLELGARPVRFHCSSRVVVTSVEKQQLWKSTQADAVEMESECIRQLCRERCIPSATVRVISDSAAENLPLDFNALMTSTQDLSYLKLASELIRSPRTILPLLELQKRTTAAARQLGACLSALHDSKFD